VTQRRLCTLALVTLVLVLPLATSCKTHRHRIAGGATGIGQQSERQWYWLFGLAQINEVNVQRMVPDLTSYDIETSQTFVDFLLAPLLFPFTLATRTVTVYR